MSWLDKSCLQLAVRRRDKVETLTFQMRSPSVKEDWVVEHRLSRLVSAAPSLLPSLPLLNYSPSPPYHHFPSPLPSSSPGS